MMVWDMQLECNNIYVLSKSMNGKFEIYRVARKKRGKLLWVAGPFGLPFHQPAALNLPNVIIDPNTRIYTHKSLGFMYLFFHNIQVVEILLFFWKIKNIKDSIKYLFSRKDELLLFFNIQTNISWIKRISLKS